MSPEIALSLRFGTASPAPAPREVMEALTEVQVTTGTGGPSGFDLKFAVSTRSKLITELLPSGFFDPPTRVVISVVVRGETTVLMEGLRTLDAAHEVAAWPGAPERRERAHLDAAHDHLALYAEHTWGADCSIAQPESIEHWQRVS